MMTTRPFNVEAADTKGLRTAAARPSTRKGIPFSPRHAMVADPLSARISPLQVTCCPESVARLVILQVRVLHRQHSLPTARVDVQAGPAA
eukprot:2368711-Amphidinium_carterae.1